MVVVGSRNPALVKRLLIKIETDVIRTEERRGHGRDQRLWLLLNDLRKSVAVG